MSRRKPSTKEFTSYPGVKASFTATINVAKFTWDMTPSEAFDWYVNHLEKRGRYATVETAQTYRDALEDDFIEWVNKNAHRRPGAIIPTQTDDYTQSAISYLIERGYTVSKD